MTRNERKAAKEVAEVLFDKLTEALPDVISDYDGDNIVAKIMDDEEFYGQFEALVFENAIKLLGGKK